MHRTIKKIDIVIVNWNSGKHLSNCIDSIVRCDCSLVNSIVIVDNHSSDQSTEISYPNSIQINLIMSDTNLGFASACNMGAKHCSADYLLFLNPDTLLYSDSLINSIEFMELKESSDYMVCGAKTIGDNNKVNRHCARFPSPFMLFTKSSGLSVYFPAIFKPIHLFEFDHLSSKGVDHVIGAFYLVRSSFFVKMKGFDERFFVYMEDIDFSKRVHESGKKVYYLADSSIYHMGGGSSRNYIAARIFYSNLSKIKYANKWFSFFGRQVASISILFIEPLTRLVHALFKLSWVDMKTIFSAYKMLYLKLWKG
jgi:N-acetylglucosaminyl-diphospho-decaprenol L-rhamnosyltransferase